ncbi:NAD-dependent epimerase/dehydratase family protein [Nakamurella alba]|uniref:NAD-dependent epimerase/dehydratase family protein n=1 Tax=Nakamurella alba TaxID=2665158 RepID=UPI002AC31394|nr:NAD-dependent epimerase/dehydratase family protein [Nakamurella alba]
MTGASGNIGSAVLADLARHPDIRVTAVARRLPDRVPPFDSADWVPLDLTATGAVDELTARLQGVSAIVNLVWGFQPMSDEKRLADVGVGSLRTVLAAAQRAGVGHVVQFSSVGAYAPPSVPGAAVDENWPTTGVPSSEYSRHKVAAEELMDEHDGRGDGPLLTRIRPGLVMQRSAASALLRYGAPAWFPRWALDLLFVLPLAPGLQVPVVYARDVAAAVSQVVLRGAGGAFNLAAPTPLTDELLASALHAARIPVPLPALRALVDVSYRLRLQRVEPGWLDLAYGAPLLDTSRAAQELDWAPTRDADQILRELISGLRDGASGPSPVLRPRTVAGELRDRQRSGAITRRRES